MVCSVFLSLNSIQSAGSNLHKLKIPPINPKICQPLQIDKNEKKEQNLRRHKRVP